MDAETAARVQEVLLEELKGATVVTVAHRVEAVRGVEGAVELAGGRVFRTEGVGVESVSSVSVSSDGGSGSREEEVGEGQEGG